MTAPSLHPQTSRSYARWNRQHSGGRRSSEPPHPYRKITLADADPRSSTPPRFRRLEAKTQEVFTHPIYPSFRNTASANFR